jgi:hypothetical protein
MRAAGHGDRGQVGATSLAALLLAFLAGLVGGALAATLIAPRPAAPEAGGERALERTLAALDESVRRIGEQLGRELPRAPASPAQPLAGTAAPPPDLAPLIASVEELAQAVRAQAGRSPALGAPLLTVPMTAPPPDRILAVVHGETAELLSRHLFWSYQQLLDTYGSPTHISIDGGYVTWQYESTDGHYVGFRLFDGMVMDLWN